MNDRFKAFIHKLNPVSIRAAGMRGARIALKNYSRGISDLNRQRLTAGKYTSGQTIQEGYSEKWGEVRRDAGLQTEYVDLKFTGAFQKSIKSDANEKFVEIQTDSPKYDRLSELFEGTCISSLLGLSDEDIQKVLLKTSPMVAEEISNYLGI